MLVQSASHISPYEPGCWLIVPPTGQRLLVNKEGAELYRILRHAASFDQARAAFNEQFQADLSTEAFQRVVWARFGGFGVLPDDAPVEQVGYIAGATQVLPARVAQWLARPLVPLMRHRWYWPLLGAQAAFIGVVAVVVPLPSEAASVYLVAAPLVAASWVIHELGHVAACQAAGIGHGGIGVGLYAYVVPVLYADVTESWQASRAARLRIDAGGIMAQVTMATGLLLGYLGTQWPTLLAASFAIAVSAAWQLNPFLRSDGYWLLSDLTRTPNLHANAMQAARRSFSLASLRRRLTGRARRPAPGQLLLGIYGVFNSLVLVAVVVWMISRHGHTIWTFPQEMPVIIRRAWQQHQWPQPQQWVALSFYAMLARYVGAQLLRGRSTTSTAPSSPA